MKEYFKMIIFIFMILLYAAFNVGMIYLITYLITYIFNSLSDNELMFFIISLPYFIFILPLTFPIFEKIADKF